jgi:hypothetical protein
VYRWTFTRSSPHSTFQDNIGRLPRTYIIRCNGHGPDLCFFNFILSSGSNTKQKEKEKENRSDRQWDRNPTAPSFLPRDPPWPWGSGFCLLLSAFVYLCMLVYAFGHMFCMLFGLTLERKKKTHISLLPVNPIRFPISDISDALRQSPFLTHNL